MQRMTVVAMAAMLVTGPAFGQELGRSRFRRFGRRNGSAPSGRTGRHDACRARSTGETGGCRVHAGITLGGGTGALA